MDIKYIKDHSGERFYPVTHKDAVVGLLDISIDTSTGTISDGTNTLTVPSITVVDTAEEGNTNPISSGGVYNIIGTVVTQLNNI